MINFSSCSIERSIAHFVGNKYIDVKSHFSNAEIKGEESISEHLKSIFLHHFKNNYNSFQFTHTINLSMNEVFVSTDNIFEGENFIANTKNIIKHLFNQTKHQSIKPGEVFVVLFNDVIYENTFCKAVGIFKSESNSNFIKLYDDGKNIGAFIDSGKHTKNIDKAALILNNAPHEGFRVYTFEKNNADTNYWRDEFLNIIPKEDGYFHTTNLLTSFKEFVLTDLPEQGKISKSEQINLINKSLDYVNENKANFSTKKFIEETLEGKLTQKQFYKFKEQYESENNINISDKFEISNDAIKKQLKQFKSVIKLDKNFHIYVHGKRDLIEQGVDKNGRKYYKIYYESES